jgi:class 3 adenylate cyclase
LQGASQGGDIVLSRDLAEDMAVAPLLQDQKVAAESLGLKGFAEPIPFVRILANIG